MTEVTQTVRQLVDEGVIERPMDGNHGELHPKTSDFVTSGIPFIMASDLRDGALDLDDCAFITPELAKTLRKGFAKTGDVLLSHKATMGRTAIVDSLPSPYVVLTPQVTYYRVLDHARLNRQFLKYYFDSADFQSLFASWGDAGSTRSYLGISAQLDLPIVLPPIDTQCAIAEVLSALDDKIRSNRKLNQLVEGCASAFFKSWFVDFDPVVAKRDGQMPAGVPAEMFDMFPSHFEESELGPIPKGWRTGRLGDVARNPRNPASPQDVECDTPYVGLEHMPRRSICLDRWGLAAEATSGKFSFREGNFLFGKLRPYFHKVGVAQADGVCSTDILVVEAHDPDYMSFVLGHLSSVEFIDYNDAGSGGTRMPRTSWDVMARFSLVIPPSSTARTLNALVEPIIAQLKANSRENRTLAALRDTLLGPLLSGEVTIKSVEKAVGAAL